MTVNRTLLAALGFVALGVTAASADSIRSDHGPLKDSIYQTVREQQGVFHPGYGQRDVRPDAGLTTGSVRREAPRAEYRGRPVR